MPTLLIKIFFLRASDFTCATEVPFFIFYSSLYNALIPKYCCFADTVTVTVLCMWNRRLMTKMFSNVVHLSHSRFHNFHNFILPVTIFVFFFSILCGSDVDAEVFIDDDDDDDDDDDGDYYDFATHVDEDDDKI
ncbi:hypothetical protein ElyMa_003249900 [Elysia marginata]|uniref:G-protein coupled receptors family 1 profile domain-containing protein n=1 Tax=Elysia marginata TaxID=1093978 RepID=A0AAV4J7T7_9GAST|nr:hypothetical protein ElyMa_003249900 [Elysia marginata]